MPGDGTIRRAQDQERIQVQAIPEIASKIARLAPGPAAALRLGPNRRAGAAAFWKLLTEYLSADAPINEEHRANWEERWAAWFQAAAILTPRGRNPNKQSAHNDKVPMGRALHDAGVSEERLARLLATPTVHRTTAVTSICRRIAAGRSDTGRNTGFNLVTMGEFILVGSEKTDRRIARDYYRARSFEAQKQE